MGPCTVQVSEPAKDKYLLNVQVVPTVVAREEGRAAAASAAALDPLAAAATASAAASADGAAPLAGLEPGLAAVSSLVKLLASEVGQGANFDIEALSATTEALGVSQCHLDVVSVRPAHLTVAPDVPTLQEVLSSCRAEIGQIDASLAAINSRRLSLRGSTQAWHFHKGGVEWLQAKHAPTPDADADAAAAGGGATAADATAAAANAPTTAQAAMARAMDKVDERLRASSALKAQRTELGAQRRRARATCHVIEELHMRSEWPEVPVPNKPELCVDLDWNFPLEPTDDSPAARPTPGQAPLSLAHRRRGSAVAGGAGGARRSSELGGAGGGRSALSPMKMGQMMPAADQRGFTQICAFCATLSPPVRGARAPSCACPCARAASRVHPCMGSLSRATPHVHPRMGMHGRCAARTPSSTASSASARVSSSTSRKRSRS